MNTFYNEVTVKFQDYLRDDVIDAVEEACITQQEWHDNQRGCIQRIYGALEEIFSEDEHQPTEHDEWMDFDPDC